MVEKTHKSRPERGRDKIDIVFIFSLLVIVILGAGAWVGYSYTGTTNTLAPGSIETTDVNFTGDWYRGPTNITDNILGTYETLTFTSEFYWNEANRTNLFSGQNAIGATAYVGFDSELEYLPNYFLCDGAADQVQVQTASDYAGEGKTHLANGAYTFYRYRKHNRGRRNRGRIYERGCHYSTRR